MNQIRFEWTCSYQDQCEYRAYGPTSIRSVERYRANQGMLDYMRSSYNGTDEEFAADILARQNSCKITYREGYNSPYPYRWTREEYQEFVEYLRTRHADDVRVTAEFRAKYPDVTFDEVKPFHAPAPIYWDTDAHTYLTEAFYSEVAA